MGSRPEDIKASCCRCPWLREWASACAGRGACMAAGLLADWTARHAHCPQSAARVQVTALGAGGKAAAGSGGGGDWDDKPASEPWSEQEQHKKVRGPCLISLPYYAGQLMCTDKAGLAGCCPGAVLAASTAHCSPTCPGCLLACLPARSACLQVLSKGRPEDGWPGIKDKQVGRAGQARAAPQPASPAGQCTVLRCHLSPRSCTAMVYCLPAGAAAGRPELHPWPIQQPGHKSELAKGLPCRVPACLPGAHCRWQCAGGTARVPVGLTRAAWPASASPPGMSAGAADLQG